VFYGTVLSKATSYCLRRFELTIIIQPLITLAVRLAIDLDIFRLVADYIEPLTSEELASLSGGEELLISRFLFLGSSGACLILPIVNSVIHT
jgi:hypothetical protein